MGSRTDISPLSLVMQRVDAIADGARAPDTIETGFPSVDKLLGGGVRRGDLVVLGGEVGAGKSALALAVALRACQGGRRVAFLSGEMSIERVLERALAIEGRARIDDMRGGSLDDATRAGVGAAALRLRHRMPEIARMPRGGADALTDFLRSAVEVEMAVLDSLQSIPDGARGQDEELASALRRLKGLAVDGNLAILLTAHLPLHRPDRPDPRPTLEDFGALGAVKHHADIVLGLFREEQYRPDRAAEGATELAVLKNRNGTTSYVDLYFYRQWLRFEDMVEPDR
jgi:replicative DNA helicase